MTQGTADSSAGTDLAKALGRHIREARAARGLTLRELAAQLGVSPATMSAIENARTGISAVRLNTLSSLLNVSLDSLMSVGDTPAAGDTKMVPKNWRTFEEQGFEPALQAALEAFLEFGYHGATMRDIAQRAGLSVPGVYHHFASKQAILQTLLQRIIEDMAWRVDAALVGLQGVHERFTALIECIALFHAYRSQWSIVATNELRSVNSPEDREVYVERIRVHELIKGTIERGNDQGIFEVQNPRIAVLSLTSSMVGIAQWFDLSGPLTAEDVADLHVGMALNLVKYNP